MKRVYFHFHWSFLLLGFLLILFNKGVIFLYYVIFGILHELGHALVGKKLGYKLNIITLMPYGASLSGNNSPLTPKDEISIAIAGPMVNVVCIIAIILLNSAGLNHEQLQIIKAINISFLFFNLLPVFPLDGGRILLAILSLKVKRQISYKICLVVGYIVTTIFFILFFVSFTTTLNYMLGINALFLLIGLFSDDKTAYYVNVNLLNQTTNRIKKGSQVKLFAVNENANLFETFKLLDKYNINEILVFDDNNNLVKTMMDFELEKHLFTKSINTKISEII